MNAGVTVALVPFVRSPVAADSSGTCARPRIFRCLSFHAPSPSISDRSCSDHILTVDWAAFRLTCLLKTAALTPMVYMWKFHNNRGLQAPTLSMRGTKRLREKVIFTTNLFIRTLPAFSNLRILILSDINVDYQARESFASLRYFNALYLSHCIVSAQKGPLLQLNIFSIFICEDYELEDESIEPKQLLLPNNLTGMAILSCVRDLCEI